MPGTDTRRIPSPARLLTCYGLLVTAEMVRPLV
jgi:hypothetical protein